MTPYEKEKFTDEHDIASELEMKFTEGRIGDVRAKARQDQQPDSDGNYAILECDECGLEIGTERLKVAPRNLMCVYCATVAERKVR